MSWPLWPQPCLHPLPSTMTLPLKHQCYPHPCPQHVTGHSWWGKSPPMKAPALSVPSVERAGQGVAHPTRPHPTFLLLSVLLKSVKLWKPLRTLPVPQDLLFILKFPVFTALCSLWRWRRGRVCALLSHNQPTLTKGRGQAASPAWHLPSLLIAEKLKPGEGTEGTRARHKAGDRVPAGPWEGEKHPCPHCLERRCQPGPPFGVRSKLSKSATPGACGGQKSQSLCPGATGLSPPRPRHPCQLEAVVSTRENCPPRKERPKSLPAGAGSCGEWCLPAPPSAPPEMFLFLIPALAGMWLPGQGPRSYFGVSFAWGGPSPPLASPRLWAAGHPWFWLLWVSPPNPLLTLLSLPPAKKRVKQRV
nr:uncharacterized protein LOC105869551 [Microcebus murinus]